MQQNTYYPKILIKLLFYGYAIGERSGRKISSKCETDTAAEEDELYQDKRGDELPEEVNTKVKLKAKIKKAMEKFKNEKEKINLTDPDAKFMKDGRYCIDTTYNCQASLSKEQIMQSSEVITQVLDRKALELRLSWDGCNSSIIL